jgi:hypothetical protein
MLHIVVVLGFDSNIKDHAAEYLEKLHHMALKHPTAVVDIVLLHETALVYSTMQGNNEHTVIKPYHRHVYYTLKDHVAARRAALPNATRTVGVLISHCYMWFCYCRNNVLPWNIWTQLQWDAIILSGCANSTIELAYELKDCTRYLIMHQDSASSAVCYVDPNLPEYLSTRDLYTGLQAMCNQYVNMYNVKYPTTFNSITLLNTGSLQLFFNLWMRRKNAIRQALQEAAPLYTENCDAWLPICAKERLDENDTDLCSSDYCDNGVDVIQVIRNMKDVLKLLNESMYFVRTRRNPPANYKATPNGISHIADVHKAVNSDRGPYYRALRYFQDFYSKT